MSKSSTKVCPRCQNRLPKSEFVTIYGYPNPRGKYCRSCHAEIEQENVASLMQSELERVAFNNQVDQEYVISLMEGRAFCLYCGEEIKRYADYTPDGKSKRSNIELDHMNPLFLGGEDDETNTVYCCWRCNNMKRATPFKDWLVRLAEPYKSLAREVYISKHGYPPEEFKEAKQDPTITIKVSVSDATLQLIEKYKESVEEYKRKKATHRSE